MSYNFYSSLHLLSLFALALALGALWGLYNSPSPDKGLKKLLLGAHGLFLLLIFLAGFGLIAKIKAPFPWPFWIYGKLAVWLLLGASPFFIKKASRKLGKPFPYFLILPGLFMLFLTAFLFVRLK